MVYCRCVCASLGRLVCVCVHVRGSKYSSENPIKEDMYRFAVLFKAFWDISTDISFNVRASGRKQTNLLLLLPFFLPLFPLFLLVFFPLCHSTSISVLHSHFSLFLPSSHHYAAARCNIFLRPSFCPSLPFAPWKSDLISYLCIWRVGHKFQLSSVLRCQSLKNKVVSGSASLHYLMYSTAATNQIPNSTDE